MWSKKANRWRHRPIDFRPSSSQAETGLASIQLREALPDFAQNDQVPWPDRIQGLPL